MTEPTPTSEHLDPGEWRSKEKLLWWEADLAGARLIMTTRLGGGSAPPYETLNLGLHVGDAPERVAQNRHSLTAAIGMAPPVVADQVHGAAAAVIGQEEAGRGWEELARRVPATDALVTRETNVALAILVADCAPVALVAPAGVLGVAHAGWRGLASGVLESTLRQMAALGGGPPNAYRAVVGPCVRGCCYEVGEEVWHRFPTACLAPADQPTARRLDLLAAVIHRLRQAGVPAEGIHALGLCSACHPDRFFSHRRATQADQPVTGRMALLGQLQAERGGPSLSTRL